MNKQKKFYAVYLAYTKYEVLTDEEINNPDIPLYPPEIARLRVYGNKIDQLNCYANTMCPASQLIEADSEAELNDKVEEMKRNFINQDWLNEHIHPYI